MSHIEEGVILRRGLNTLHLSSIIIINKLKPPNIVLSLCYSQVQSTAAHSDLQQTTLCLKWTHHLPGAFAWPLNQALMAISRSHHGIRTDFPCCHRHWDFFCSVMLGSGDVRSATQPRNHLHIHWPSTRLAWEDKVVLILVFSSFEFYYQGTGSSQLLSQWCGPYS